MTHTPTFDDIFAVFSAATDGDFNARVVVPDDPQVDDLNTRFAVAVNRLLDSVASRSVELERIVAEQTEQLQQSEAKFHKAFLASPAAISIASLPDGRWLEINDALIKMTGYTRAELIGHTSAELGLVDSVARAKILEAIRLHGVVRDVEIQMRTKSNELVDVLVSTEQIDLNGLPCALTIQHDISALKRAEREVRRLNDDLQQRQVALQAVNQELEAFSYSVAHDLRAPLRGIDGFSRFLLEDHASELSSEGQHYLDMVRKNAKQMGQLIDDLLAFSRLGRKLLDSQPVALSDLVRRVLEELGSEQENRHVEFSIDELPICQGDPAMLKQVFVNLLGNALKFTRQREIACIQVGHQLIDKQQTYFVKDNGVGFDMQYADKLFGVFQRLHSSSDFEGTGVGLAIVKRIIQRHGGHIWVEAAVDQGATFYFTLSGGL